MGEQAQPQYCRSAKLTTKTEGERTVVGCERRNKCVSEKTKQAAAYFSEGFEVTAREKQFERVDLEGV